MSHLDPQPEDNDDVLSAKRYVAGYLDVDELEARRLMIAVIDDRSNWIAKAAEMADTMADAVAQISTDDKQGRELISLMAGQAREIYGMLNLKNTD